MATMVRVTGMNTVLANLKRADTKMAAKFKRNLKLAGLYLQRESQKLVPVDKGLLKNSAFTRAHGTGWKTDVRVGFTMEYAVYVHENLDAKHNEGQEAKYLEKPAREKRPIILRMIAGV